MGGTGCGAGARAAGNACVAGAMNPHPARCGMQHWTAWLAQSRAGAEQRDSGPPTRRAQAGSERTQGVQQRGCLTGLQLRGQLPPAPASPAAAAAAAAATPWW